MSVRRTGIRLTVTLAVCAALAACATPPLRDATPPTVTALPEIARPVPVAPPAVAHHGQPWASITANDALNDCSDSALVQANISMYTRSPERFEQLLAQALPLLTYVHDQLQDAGIPGEFAMLPMLESSYNPSARRGHNGPAGMWQFLASTARLHGMHVSRQYDGRMDPVASTRAAVKMLTRLHDQFDDWRLVTMAYNAGPYAVSGAIAKHPDLGSGAIPNIAASSATRTHLARMLALSCILRHPAQFHVELPQPESDTELAAVKVPAGTRLKDAAAMAEIAESELRTWNPGYLGTTVPARSARMLLLPAKAAESLADAMSIDDSESIAEAGAPASAASSDGIPLPAEPVPPQGVAFGTVSADPASRHHRVRSGETLWSIAREYGVTVRQLERWNDLHGDDLRAGTELAIHG